MIVKQLVEMLHKLPQDAKVHLDVDGYPSVDGAYFSEDYKGDPEDAPPENVVLLEYSEWVPKHD